MGVAGHGLITYARLKAALAAGDLELVRRYAREQGPLRLDDALQVCLLYRDRDAASYDAAAVRWVGRFALEARSATVADVRAAAEAFEDLPEAPDDAMERLAELCVRHGLRPL